MQKFRMLLALLAWPALVGAAQRTIELDVQTRDDAVSFYRVTSGGADVECGFIRPPQPGHMQPVTPFEAGDDWLQPDQ